MIANSTTLLRRLRAMGLTLLAATLALLPGSTPADSPPAAATAPPAVKAEDRPEVSIVSFEMLATNHMLVRAKINDKGPFSLIFDVGAPVTLLSNKAAETSGVVKANAPRSFLFAMRGEAEVGTIKVGGLVAKDVPVIVLDHPLLKAMGQMLGRRLDGIMGYTFFARYKTTIDYQSRTMTFEPVENKVRNLMKDLPDRLAGPRVAKHRVLAPGGLWGLSVDEAEGGVDARGIPVRSVLADSPASTAGLKPGDILTTIDGRWTTSIADAYAAASGVAVGKETSINVLRNGQELTLTIRPSDGF
ncbi:PDZ domain-containing protein [Singulisphaera sp. PoT]|uniref:PDZ domain-containing protein n=1 Tax=Singulisphaera sp. PoT TaxID=3411797 RepID=UPI003BF4F908